MTSRQEHTSPPFTAIILCGGRSNRMGTDKAFIKIDGIPLLQRQISLARQCNAQEIIISGHHDADYTAYHLQVIYDATPDCGPIGGLIAGLTTAQNPLILLLAVDMPHLIPDIITTLHQHTTPNCGAVYHADSNHYEPLCTYYPKNLLTSVQQQHAQGNYSLQPFIHQAIQNNHLKSIPIPHSQKHHLKSCNHITDIATPSSWISP